MTHPNAMPCRINGKLYPSQKAAAQAMGVTRNAISMAIARGRPDRVGCSTGRHGNKNSGRKVEIFGLTFPTRKDAARAFGMDRNRFSRLFNARTPAAMEILLAARMKMDARQAHARWQSGDMTDRKSDRMSA